MDLIMTEPSPGSTSTLTASALLWRSKSFCLLAFTRLKSAVAAARTSVKVKTLLANVTETKATRESSSRGPTELSILCVSLLISVTH
uniref:Uncharacterized protein n=1 Tax=Anguilla anguilla TaxID=7936 RepID=A0A0E9SLC6_ANGAN